MAEIIELIQTRCNRLAPLAGMLRPRYWAAKTGVTGSRQFTTNRWGVVLTPASVESFIPEAKCMCVQGVRMLIDVAVIHAAMAVRRRACDFVWPAVCFVVCCAAAVAADPPVNPGDAKSDSAKISQALTVLERDLTNRDYLDVLATMIPTDLAAEWQRVATEDNYHLFAERHGGVEKLSANPTLKAAYERRKAIATAFLDLMRATYAKKNIRPPFDDEGVLTKALASASKRGEGGVARSARPCDSPDRRGREAVAQLPRADGPRPRV